MTSCATVSGSLSRGRWLTVMTSVNVCSIGAGSDDKLRYCEKFIEPWSVVNSDECV